MANHLYRAELILGFIFIIIIIISSCLIIIISSCPIIIFTMLILTIPLVFIFSFKLNFIMMRNFCLITLIILLILPLQGVTVLLI